MLLASLMIADELSDAYDKIKELEAGQNGAASRDRPETLPAITSVAPPPWSNRWPSS